MKAYKLFSPLLFLISACDSSESSTSSPSLPVAQIPSYDFSNSTNLPIPNNVNSQEYKVLLYGNSHIAGLSKIIKTFVETAIPNKTIQLESASSQLYLEERLYDGTSINFLKDNNWTHVIFQAQKYSQSGQVDYPIDGAKKWVQLTKELKATPILFPEHPQKGSLTEGAMVHKIHTRIASQESSCVAPIGLTWDQALRFKPELKLHNPDGNHASNVGKFLTALVFYQIITGNSADLMPYIDNLGVNPEVQGFLGQMASQIIAENPACDY